MSDTIEEDNGPEQSGSGIHNTSQEVDSVDMIRDIRGLVLKSRILVKSMQEEVDAEKISLGMTVSRVIPKYYQHYVDQFLKDYASFGSIAELSLRRRFLTMVGYGSDEQIEPDSTLVKCVSEVTLEAERRLDIYFDQQQRDNRWTENGHLGATYKSIKSAPWPTRQDILGLKVMITDILKKCKTEADSPDSSHTLIALYKMLDLALQTLVLMDCVQFQRGLAARLDVSLIYLRQLSKVYSTTDSCPSYQTTDD